MVKKIVVEEEDDEKEEETKYTRKQVRTHAGTGDSNDHYHWGDGRPPLTPYSPSQASMMLVSSKK